MKLQRQVISILFVLTVVSALLLSFVINKTSERFNSTLIQNNLSAQSKLSASTLESLLGTVGTDLDIISRNSVVRQYFSINEAERYDTFYTGLGLTLQRYIANNPFYSELVIVLPDGYQDIFLANKDHAIEDYDDFVKTIDFEKLEINQRIDSLYKDNQDELVLASYLAIPLNTYTLKGSNNKVVGLVKIELNLQKFKEDFSTDQYKINLYPVESGADIPDEPNFESQVIRVSDLIVMQVKMPTNTHEIFMNQIYWSTMIGTSVVVGAIILAIYFLLSSIVIQPLERFRMLIENVEKKSFSLSMVQYNDSFEINEIKRKFVGLIDRVRKTSNDLERQAFTDALTGLPNRAAMYKMLEKHIQQCKNKPLSILFLDLDGFKQVNDILGHEVGDELLVAVSARLNSIVRTENDLSRKLEQSDRQDRVIRLGGDEFTILLPGKSDAELVANRIVRAFKTTFEVSGKSIYAGVSIGISQYPNHSEEISMLLKYADIAMYQAKSEGKMRPVVYSEALAIAELKKKNVKRIMREGIERNLFTAFFQSKIDIRSGELYGIEALARLPDSNGQYISPVDFIPEAKVTGMLEHITCTVMEKSCQLLASLNHPNITLSINIEPTQLNDLRLLADLRLIMWRHRVKPEQIEFEVTEDELISDADNAKRSLALLKKFGFKTALDDFGVGYSSLGHLRSFQFDSLKLDRIFVSTEDYKNKVAVGILSAIKTLADTLEMHIVVEGIETEEQVEFIRKFGITTIQGFLFSKPLSADEFANKYFPNRKLND